jgi:hypothetical protein
MSHASGTDFIVAVMYPISVMLMIAAWTRVAQAFTSHDNLKWDLASVHHPGRDARVIRKDHALIKWISVLCSTEQQVRHCGAANCTLLRILEL